MVFLNKNQEKKKVNDQERILIKDKDRQFHVLEKISSFLPKKIAIEEKGGGGGGGTGAEENTIDYNSMDFNLGQPRQYKHVRLEEKSIQVGGIMSSLLSKQQKDDLMLVNSYDEGTKNYIRALILMGIRTGILEKPSKILENTACRYHKGSFSVGDGFGFCAIGALAHDYFGWDGISQRSVDDGHYYIHMPQWMRVILNDILTERIYDQVMRINDGYLPTNNKHERNSGYLPAINYLKAHKL